VLIFLFSISFKPLLRQYIDNLKTDTDKNFEANHHISRQFFDEILNLLLSGVNKIFIKIILMYKKYVSLCKKEG